MQGEICFSVARDLYNLIMTSVTQSFEACRKKPSEYEILDLGCLFRVCTQH